ncbi:phosphodiester glycosidase family protein [Brevibacillus fluminis]|uniref:Phosphodiester glycosidase family protein n=1 Tax=Brevibacillus fluminis TaxID=511487 RepID=A0A3M8CWQ6_9BACL|nr:phosphodiester glycosidase family protein [Brevibacillus fluminis]RNB80123.1 phosphodiester glycosidase family protein [Brevibacillus fluminis]
MRGKWAIHLCLLCAPVIGFYTAFAQTNPVHNIEATSLQLPLDKVTEKLGDFAKTTEETQESVDKTTDELEKIHSLASKEKKEYDEQNKQLDNLISTSKDHLKQSGDVLDTVLSGLLGNPIGQTFGKNATVKVYSLAESGYSGYMAKVRLTNPNALKMVLANDKVVSKGETTSHAAKRKGALLAINAGGFNTNKNGTLSPLGVTVVDGQIKTFSTNTKLSFVGFNNQGHLVGGKLKSQSEVKQKGILQGASFLPTLLQGGKKQPIPRDWANTKHPRTLIGHFTNGDILIIVIDGRGGGGSNGVTLEEAQNKLLEFHVRDAYNLDGGGSSAFYYKGKILNHPSDGRERPVTSNIVVMP